MASASSKSQLISGTFRFTVRNVSQLVRTTSTQAIAGAKFRCVVSRSSDGRHLGVTVSADGNYGELESKVEVTVLHQTEPSFDFGCVENFTFSRTTPALQWAEFAEWDHLTDDVGFVTGNDSMDVEVTITSVDLRRANVAAVAKESKRRSAHEKENCGASANAHGRETGDYDCSAAVASTSSAAGAKRSSTENATTGAVASTSSGVAAKKLKTESSVTMVITSSFSGPPAKKPKTESAPTVPKNTLPPKKKNTAHRSTQTEKSVSHQLTQTEDDDEEPLFSSKIDPATLASAFECQVCHSFYQPPISFCVRGHSICADCLRGVHQCPSCEAVFFENTRNFALEGIMDYVLYPCVAAASGCRTRCTLAERERHRFECAKREIDCVFPSCAWKAAVDRFSVHCGERHPETRQLHENVFQNFCFPIANYAAQINHGEFFIGTLNTGPAIKVSFLKVGAQFFLCVKVIGTRKEARDLLCQVVLSSKQKSVQYRFDTTFQLHCDLERQHQQCVPCSTLDAIRENGLVDANNFVTVAVRVFARNQEIIEVQ